MNETRVSIEVSTEEFEKNRDKLTSCHGAPILETEYEGHLTIEGINGRVNIFMYVED